MKKILVFSLLFFMAFSTAVRSPAQGLYVRTNDQKVKAFDLTTLQNLSFLNNSLLIKKITGSTESYNLSTISALYFNSLYTGSKMMAGIGKDDKLSVYPNPASTYIRISGIVSQSVLISVISLDGRTRIKTEITSADPVLPINELERGMYLLRIDNQVIKFIRQ